MSSSNPNSAIFMTDTPKQIKNKMNRHAFSGGQETLEEHRRLGGNPDVDVSYIYLTYFAEDDDKLAEVYKNYKAGTLLTGELKKLAIDLLQEYVQQFQAKRATVDDKVLEEFMRPRKLEWRGNPRHPPADVLKEVKKSKK